MRISVGAVSDIGRARERNEDGYLVDESMYAVADGMGGHQAGDVASALALETLERLIAQHDMQLAEAVREANGAVFERSASDQEVSGMGTTLTAVRVDGRRLRLAHVGDSRAYLFREGRLRRLTDDHTLVNRMIRAGELSEEQARVHPQRSVLTRALGVEPDVEVDEGVLDAEDGDRVLLCTDGLTGMIGEDRISQVLAELADPQEAAQRLVAEANAAGGLDNITVVILDLLLEPGDAAPAGADPSTSQRDDASGGWTAGGPAVATEAAERPARRGEAPPDSARVSRGPRWWRLAAVLAVLVLLVVGALVGVRLFVDRQWFVGVHDGNVTVFRGIPTGVAGLSLNSPVEETDISAVDAEQLQFWRGRLDDGITVEGREEADALVDRIRQDVREAEREAAGAGGAGGGGDASP